MIWDDFAFVSGLKPSVRTTSLASIIQCYTQYEWTGATNFYFIYTIFITHNKYSSSSIQ